MRKSFDPTAFDFGGNWMAFSQDKLDDRRLEMAVQSLRMLVREEDIVGRSFLDVGCGSGLFSIAAAVCGADRVVGIDINTKSIDASIRNVKRLGDAVELRTVPEFCAGDVLDKEFLNRLPKFDVVYAWGSLHHTGALWQAIHNAASMVRSENGMLVLAIYNHHWTSPLWKQMKRFYNLSPRVVRCFLHGTFGLLIYMAVWASTRENPFQKERGMSFWYDVIDWLGGYPYEYTSYEKVIDFATKFGFEIKRFRRPRVPTGCNEFVFTLSHASYEEQGVTQCFETDSHQMAV